MWVDFKVEKKSFTLLMCGKDQTTCTALFCQRTLLYCLNQLSSFTEYDLVQVPCKPTQHFFFNLKEN